MSDLPSSPGVPFAPFAPGGPGGPCDPFFPSAPGGPTHTHIHAYTIKYCDVFRICLQTKDYQYFVSLDQHCWKTNKYEYGQGKRN